MIVYAKVSHLTMQCILQDLAKYWTLKYSGTNASEILLDRVNSAKARGQAVVNPVGRMAFRRGAARRAQAGAMVARVG